jgi:hypothetical protein
VEAIGKRGERYFDNTLKATIGSAVINKIQHIYLTQEYQPTSKNGDYELGVTVKCPLHTRKHITLNECVRDSLRGGDTYQNRRVYGNIQLDGSDIEDGATSVQVAGYDINSSYPSTFMKDLPISYKGFQVKKVPETYEMNKYDENTLLWVELDMRGKEDGLGVRVGNSSMSPKFIPHLFYDPADKDLRLNWVWNVELIPFVEWGATCIVYGVIEFNSAPVFKEFCTEVYGERLRAKGIDPLTFLPIPNAVEDAFTVSAKKNELNNTFGKTAQKDKPEVNIVHDYEQLLHMMTEVIADVNIIRLPYHEAAKVTLYRRHAHVGDLSFMASNILARARRNLNTPRVMWSKFMDMRGDPAYPICGDTDSMIAPVLADTPASRQFLESIIHPYELGKWKEEFRTDYYVLAAAKKMYCVYLGPDPKTGKPLLKRATKGVPKDILGLTEFQKLVLNNEPVIAPMGLSFQATMSHLKENTNITREIKCGNVARKWLGNESLAWDSIDEFLNHLYSPDVICLTSECFIEYH